MDYTLYTFGGGITLQNLFNGIAAAVGSQSYITLIKISALFGFGYVLIEALFRQQFLLNIRWFISFFLIYQILLVPKVTIHISDEINHDHFVVDNVPWGLALFSSVTSLVGYSLTELTESVFSLPDDLRYSRTGSVMASELVKDTLSAHITSHTFAKNIQHFIEQCVFYDILLGKYTVDDLLRESNIWSFVSNNTSSARAFKYDHSIVTCKKGIQTLSKDFTKEVKDTQNFLGFKLFPSTKNSKQLFVQYLPIGFQYLTQATLTQDEIIQQALMANAIQDAIVKNGTQLNASATIEGFATLRANHLKQSTYLITGSLAARWLSIMKNVFEALFYGAFLFLALVFILPWGTNILKGYVFSLFWLQSWAPLYAVLNLIMTLNARTHSIAATQGQLSLSNLHSLSQVNSDTIALAGFLSMSIPFIAYGIVKGGASSFTHLASHIGGVSQQAAVRAGEEMTSGNYSFGNTQFANHSMQNVSGFHYQTNPLFQSGLITSQMPTGTLVGRTADSHSVFDAKAAISHTATQINWADSIRTMSSQQSESALSEGMQKAHHYSDAVTTTMREMMELSNSKGFGQFTDQSYNHHHSGQWSQSLQKFNQAVQDFRKDTHFTEQQSARLLAQAMLEGHIGGGWDFLVKAGGQLRLSGGFEGVTNAEYNEGLHRAKSFVEQSNFANVFDEAVRSSKDESSRASDETMHRKLDSIGKHYDDAQSYRFDVNAHLQKSESYRQLSNLAQENGLNLNNNLAQPFVNWLIQQPSPYGQGKIGVSGAEYLLNNELGLTNDYVKSYLNSIIEPMSHSVGDASDIFKSFNSDKSVGMDRAFIREHYDQQKIALSAVNETNNPLKNTVSEEIADVQSRIVNGKQEMTSVNSQHKIDKKLDNVKGHVAGNLFGFSHEGEQE